MKTFNDILNELAEPKARKEKEFKDKHVVQKMDHPVTDMDALTAKSMKKDKTKKASLHDDEDEAVYEEVELDEDITKMSHGRLKWHMNTGVPHGSYTKDEMKKERDRRLSRVDTHAAYKKAKAGLSEAAPKIKHTIDTIKKEREKNREHDAAMGRTPTGRKKPVRSMTSTQKSMASMRNEEVELDEAFNIEIGTKVAMKKGGKLVYGKVVGKEKVMGKPGVEVKWSNGIKGRFSNDRFAAMSMDRNADYVMEEVDQLAEISKKTLGSYVKKASSDVANKSAEHDVTMATHSGPEARKHRMGLRKDIRKREAGMGKALDRLTKEEVELDEISTSTLQRYKTKASKDIDFTNDENIVKKRSKGYAMASKKLTDRIMKKEEVELDEAVEVSHDRYMRSHGKRASGGHGMWMFTHKRMGDANVNDPKEVHSASGKFADAKKSAQQWAKKNGHSTVYVMEEVEQLDELSPNTLHSYIKGASKDLAKRSRMSGYDDKRGNYADGDKNRKRANKRMAGIASASGRMADKANQNEEVDLDEVLDTPKAMQSYKNKANRSKDRASNSAIAKMLRSKDGPQAADISKETETMDKRKKCLKMADRNAARKTRAMLMKKEEVELDEVSTSTLQRYKSKAAKDIDFYNDEKIVNKRSKGYAMASKKLTNRIMKKEEAELDEDVSKMSHGRLKFHMNNKHIPHGSYSWDQMKAERDRRLKTGQGEEYKKAKSSMSETAETLDKALELDEKGLWANIHAKRKRIKAGSGERMRKPGSKGAPTDADFKSAQESTQIDEISKEKAYKYWHKSYEDETERRGDIINRKTPATSDEKRKIANRAAGRKLATARVLGKDGMAAAQAAKARGKAGKKDKAVGSAVFQAFRKDRKKAKAEEK
jgi:hypothetical protein